MHILKEVALIKNKALKEDELKSIKRMVRGRWYTELLGHGTNIYELSSKQKLVQYINQQEHSTYWTLDTFDNFIKEIKNL